jgi:hypothetical protein
MKKSHAYLPMLLAGLLASAGVYAQSTYGSGSSGSSDLPPKAGEASTQTNGVPNAATTNSHVSEAPAPAAGTMPSDTRAMGAGAATSSVVPKPGEASTYVMGSPNADPMKPRAMTRAEVVGELMGRPQAFQALRSQMHPHGGTVVIASAMPATPAQ